MRVEVSIPEDARAAYADWIDGWGIDDPEVRALNRLYAKELIGVLSAKQGQIEAAKCIHQEEPCVYEWKYTGDMTIRFMNDPRLPNVGIDRARTQLRQAQVVDEKSADSRSGPMTCSSAHPL